MRHGIYLSALVFTFASGYGGIGYREFAHKMRWPIGSAWGRPALDLLCLAAMLIGVTEAWGEYGVYFAVGVAFVGFLMAFTLTLVLKQRIQTFNLIGITAGTAFSLFGSAVLS